MNNLQDALEGFLEANATDSNRDLIQRLLACWPIEVTVLPTKVGEHDGHDLFPICYPEGNKTDPNWTRDGIRWPLEYAQDIGATGFTSAGSLFVAMDIDSTFNHVKGLSTEDLEAIVEAVKNLDYVEIRRSTSGLGYHLYVWLDFIDTKNHDEHAAVGRAVLGKICHDAQLDFQNDVDKYGRNTWFYSTRKQNEDSFKQVKPSERKLHEVDLPGWRDNIPVIQRKAVKVDGQGLPDEESCARATVRRDEEHQRIIDALMEEDHYIAWMPDYGCYHVHTLGLKAVHDKLDLKGAFETHTDGVTKFNAFMFVKPNGVFYVCRIRKDTEHPLWEKTNTNLAAIYYNAPVSMATAARVVKAVRTGETSFSCGTVKQAKEAAALFKINLPDLDEEKPVDFTFKSGILIIEADRKGKTPPPPGWGTKGRRLRYAQEIEEAMVDEGDYDSYLRHLTSPTNEDAGWALKRKDNTWGIENQGTLKNVLLNKGLATDMAWAVLGGCAEEPWNLVNEPFEAEFLSGRRWNRHGKRLIKPEPGEHPTYDTVFKHLGSDLDHAVFSDPWCQANNVKSGADWLKLWAASVFQRPKLHTPALIFWSVEQETGKSTFQRCLAEMIQGPDGTVDIYNALTEKFNDALAGCVIGYVEDKDLGTKGMLKVKGWIDSPTIPIRAMRTNQYTLPNYLHVILAVNTLEATPLEPADRRFTVVHVPYQPMTAVSKVEMEAMLQREAKHFLHTLLNIPMPIPVGRLSIPVLETETKRIATKTLNVDVQLMHHVARFARQQECWEGTMTELLDYLPVDLKSPGAFSTQLDLMQPILKRQGVLLDVAQADREGKRYLSLGLAYLMQSEDVVAEEIFNDE